MYGRFFGLHALGSMTGNKHERTTTGPLGPSASVYRCGRALVTWLTHGRNVTFALVRFSIHYAISALLQTFNGTAGKILIETRYDSDVPTMTSSGNVVLLSYIKEMRNLGVAATAGRTNTLENGISCLTTAVRQYSCFLQNIYGCTSLISSKSNSDL